MKQVTINLQEFPVSFKHEGRQFDKVRLTRTSNSKMYFTAYKEGIPYCEIAKRMQFDDTGNVYVTFGKYQAIIGKYTEVPDEKDK